MSEEFNGKVVWVVGASGGLGSAIAQAFLRAGAKLALSGRDLRKITSAAGDYADSDRVLMLPIDITKSVDVNAAVTEIVMRLGTVDVLVNTTSVSTFGDFLKLDDAAWREVYEAKLFAYARTMRAVIPHMLQHRRGVIINVSGNGGKFPNFPSHIAGSSGNAAVDLMTKAVSDLYASEGIRANCIAPGAIRTPRLDSITKADDALDRHTQRQALDIGANVKARPPGDPSDIAAATLFLASDRAKHINGIVLTVDGGATPTT